MDSLAASCNDALNYPKNLLKPSVHEFTLDTFYDRLNAQEPRLFHHEKKAAVDVLEFADGGNGLCIPQLGWSGRSFELCYNLKSVCAVHHSFDSGNGRATWIIVEANPLVKKRLVSATGSRGLPDTKSFQTVEKAFESSLMTQLIMCDWAAENWRWYINFLEDECQTITRGSLSKRIETPLSPVLDENASPIFARANTQTTYKSAYSTFPRNSTQTSLKCSLPALPHIQTKSPQKTLYLDRALRRCPDASDAALKSSQHASPTLDMPPTEAPYAPPSAQENVFDEQVTFRDLQRIQFIEENINEVKLILNLNISVLTELSRFYNSLTSRPGWPDPLTSSCRAAMAHFKQRVDTITNDLSIQQMRTEMLLRMLADRKSLTHGIFDVQNMEANKKMAAQAQLSAQNMEYMTRDMSEMTQDMNDIAKKTKLETVSMRIITLVTLFFLPGTFISTLMSTDIIRFEKIDAVNLNDYDYVLIRALAMVERQPDDIPVIQDFLSWIDSPNTWSLGCRGAGNEIDCRFIPYKKLEAYFARHLRIQNLLIGLFPEKDLGQLPNPETIRTRYLRIFCILLRIHHGRFIECFVHHDGLADHNLPFESKHPRWPSSTDPKFFDNFHAQQWPFCAAHLKIHMDDHFDKDRILPIIEKKELSEGGSAITHRVVVEDEYNELIPRTNDGTAAGCQRTNVFVVKTYWTRDAKIYFQNECEAFRRLKSQNIIGFYGSFIHNGTYNVILEFADKGNLEDFLRTHSPPSSGEDIYAFWVGLLGVVRGLRTIHGTQQISANGPQILLGSHGKSRYQLQFKIADLGLSHFKQNVVSPREARHNATRGTYTYGAPECDTLDMPIGCPMPVGQSVDIWSLGCVFSVVATWIGHDWHMVLEYSSRRRAEVKRALHIPDGDCFHDGTQVLKTVNKHHAAIIQNLRPKDFITRLVLSDLVANMLEKAEGRPDARMLHYKANQIIDRAGENLRESKAGIRPSLRLVDGLESGSDSGSPPRPPPELPRGQVRYRSGSTPRSRPLSGEQSLISARTFESDSSPQSPNSWRHWKPSLKGPPHRHLNRHKGESSSVDEGLPPSEEREAAQFLPRLPKHTATDQPQSPTGIHYDVARYSQAQALFQNRSPSTENQRNNKDNNCTSSQPPKMTNLRVVPPGLRLPVSETRTGHASPTPLTEDSLGMTTTFPTARSQRHHLSPTGGPMAEISASYDDAPSQQQHPYMSIQKGLEWKRAKEQGYLVKPLHGMLLEILVGRDHAFLIDNAPSMAKYRSHVREVFELLSYLVKGSDPDGLDLYFSTSLEKLKPKTNADMLKELDKRPPAEGFDMRFRFNAIIEAYQNKLDDKHLFRALFRKSRGPRKLSLYVLTDGVWQPKCDLKTTIRTLVSHLEDHKLTHQQIGIQFIQFGNDQTGTSRLKELDSELKLTLYV
ncbi:MAG: hypothetical protein Q9217_002021 [Psora testacea]